MRANPTYSRDESFAHSHIEELKIEMKIGSSAAPKKPFPYLSLTVASESVDLFVHRRVDSSLAALSCFVILLPGHRRAQAQLALAEKPLLAFPRHGAWNARKYRAGELSETSAEIM